MGARGSTKQPWLLDTVANDLNLSRNLYICKIKLMFRCCRVLDVVQLSDCQHEVESYTGKITSE